MSLNIIPDQKYLKGIFTSSKNLNPVSKSHVCIVLKLPPPPKKKNKKKTVTEMSITYIYIELSQKNRFQSVPSRHCAYITYENLVFKNSLSTSSVEIRLDFPHTIEDCEC